MIYKTLIIFDTGKLRHTKDANVCYSEFSFGSGFTNLEKFIAMHRLRDLIHIGVPDYVIQELLKQKEEKYTDDLKKYSEAHSRLEKIGVVKPLMCCCVDFGVLLEKSKDDYLQEHNIRAIQFHEDQQQSVFEAILSRAIKRELPFKKTKNSADAGFKDVVIWETVLHSRVLESYDQIYFFAEDGGFDNCGIEFIEKRNINFEIIKDAASLEEKLLELYKDLIENQKVLSLIGSSYFSDQVKQYLTDLDSWEYDGEEFDIVDVDILKKYTDIEKTVASEEGESDTFRITTYVSLSLEREDDETGLVQTDTDAYVTTTIDGNNDFIDFEIE